MIAIKVRGKHHRVREITVSGHAVFTKNGKEHAKDIVCSAVSALTIAMINGLTDVVGRQDLSETARDGYVHFVIPDIDDKLIEMKTDVLVSTYLLAIHEIQKDWGNYVRIEGNYK